MRLRHAVVSFALAAGFAGSATEAAPRPFEIRSFASAVDPVARLATFTVEFSESPDFFDILGEGDSAVERQSFQYFIDSEPLIGPEFVYGPDVSVVRGPEIRSDPDGLLRIRATDASDPDPVASGWGPLRGRVPYELDAAVLSFTIPWDVLGETDGEFTYLVEAYEDGSLTSSRRGIAGQAIPLPLPPGAWTGLSMLGAIVAVQLVRSRRPATRR